jgi:3-oxoacyl-[acyl-carrier protein] reductase
VAIIDKALDGQVALVTGGSRGIGRAIAIALGRRGAKIVLNYAAREDAARQTAELVKEAGGSAVTTGWDVADRAAAAEGIKAIGKEHGGLSILVNNAGVAINGLTLRFKESDWVRLMNINLNGAFWVCQAATPLLLRAKSAGRIINIVSVVGEIGNAGQAAYAASKAGLIGLTKSLAREYAGRGVCVNAIAPGFIETDMTAEHLPDDQRDKLLGEIPLGRIGTADDIGHLAAFLAGPEAAYITGQVLRVNGGMLM